MSEKVKEGDVINGLCCEGFDWTCAVVLVAAWGHCDNPDCTAGVYDNDDTYKSVSNWYDEDIADRMAELAGAQVL